ncbi:intradiol ring-cleavage dioxygenase [Massilia aerilata]|uniref:Intradiol ring-cleavage dioxygenase n=1 Tax=Massilia aerilata TaxID=453817 RepID=A0ABW0RT00_9BURK
MDHHRDGLAEDLEPLLEIAASRRQSLRWLLGGMAALPLASCGGGSTIGSVDASTASSAGTASTGSTGNSCAVIPEETGGPYPGDGTNSNGSGVANALTLSGIVRSDIRASVSPGSATAQGIPLTIRLQLVNVGAGCAPIAGATVYLWHCDRDGNYSMYASGLTRENYLRGVQAADADGHVTFTSIFPGCYAGRMPHVHFEVFPSLAKAASAAGRIKTSQFTFPMATLNEVYANTAYAASSRNLASISYATDNVFSDGTSLQMGSVSGNASTGYTVTLVVGVSL